MSVALLAAALTIGDLRRIADLEQPAISPDGSRVALTVIRQRYRPSGYDNAVVLVRVADGSIQTIVAGHEAALPRWSPNGSRLAYLARDPFGRLQAYVWDGRRSREISHAPGDVADIVWRPDGRAIAFAASDASSSPAYFYAGDNDYTLSAPIAPLHLWTVPSNGGAARRLTSGTWTLPPTDYGGIFTPQFTWSPDGRRIVLTRVANTFTGDDQASSLWQLDVASLHMRSLTGRSASELTPAFSPDGSQLAYWYPRDGAYLAHNSVRVISAGGDRLLSASLDRNIGGSLWMPNGRSLLICYNDHTQTNAALLGLDGSVRPLNLGDLSIICDSYQSATFDAGVAASVSRDGTIAFLANGPTSDRELYLLSRGSSPPRRLTHFNDFLARITPGTARELHWRADGFDEYGVVVTPPDMAAGRKYPIVVLIHGGPGASDVRIFSSEVWSDFWPQAQLLAAHGYVVFQPNYRGSDDDGNAFALAIFRDTVAGPARDILAGLDEVKRLPYADGTRIAVGGWSYGGLLTSWLITQTHEWRAAISGAAVDDEINEYATSTSNVQNRYYVGTSPFAAGGDRIYVEQSPITFAGAVTTPTLIWGTTLDPVVPISQAYAFYHALLENHVPVRFAVFPASTHGPADPVQTAELTRLWFEWLDRWMR